MLAFKALKGAGWLVSSRFIGRIIDFFNLLILARILTPADFGLVALAMSLVMVIDTVLEMPVTQALVRLPTIDKSHLDTGFTLSIMRSGVIVIAVMAATWPFAAFNHDTELIPIVACLAIGPIVRGFFSPAMVHFARNLGFWQTFVMEVSGKLVAFAAAIATVLAGGTYWAIVVNFVTSYTTSTIVSYLLAPYRPALSLARFRDFAGFVGWYSAAQVVSALNWQFDRVMIGALSAKAALGRYAVASDVATLPTQSLIGPALQPVMAAFSMIGSDHERLRLAFLKAARFAMVVSVPTCLGLSLTADLATTLLLGAQWTEAAPILAILALSVAPIPYYQTLYSLCMAVDRTNEIFRLNWIDLVIRLVCLPVGFFAYAVVGVSLARVVLALVMFGFYLASVRKLLGIGWLRQLANIWKIVAAGLIMATEVVLVRHLVAGLGLPAVIELGLLAGSGALGYAVALFALGLRLHLGGGRFEIYDRR